MSTRGAWNRSVMIIAVTDVTLIWMIIFFFDFCFLFFVFLKYFFLLLLQLVFICFFIFKDSVCVLGVCWSGWCLFVEWWIGRAKSRLDSKGGSRKGNPVSLTITSDLTTSEMLDFFTTLFPFLAIITIVSLPLFFIALRFISFFLLFRLPFASTLRPRKIPIWPLLISNCSDLRHIQSVRVSIWDYQLFII